MKKVLLSLIVLGASSFAHAADDDIAPSGYNPAIHEYTCSYDDSNWAGWTSDNVSGTLSYKFIYQGQEICGAKTTYRNETKAGDLSESQESDAVDLDDSCNSEKIAVDDERYKKGEIMLKNNENSKHEICHKISFD